jgi:hypothetical protein
VQDCVAKACAQAQLDPAQARYEAACFGMSGGPDDKEALSKRISEKLYENSLNDKKFALAALKYCSDGKRMPVVVFDNVDQLGTAVQTHIFTTA